MKVFIYTPTQRPGIDVTHHSVLRQKTEAQIKWFVFDELLDVREQDVDCTNNLDDDIDKTFFNHPVKEGAIKNMALGYNIGLEEARKWGADLFLSLQDYIWVPEDGVQKFVDAYRTIEVKDDYKAIFTGICSITSDPGDDKIKDINGLYTIFNEPYTDRPQNIEWMDVRYKADHHFASIPQIEFETNWACIPRSSLYNEELIFDEEFDKASAYENQDYAYKARSLGIDCLVDMDNKVLSLPHKRYFADEWAIEEPLTHINRELCERKWGHYQGL